MAFLWNMSLQANWNKGSICRYRSNSYGGKHSQIRGSQRFILLYLCQVGFSRRTRGPSQGSAAMGRRRQGNEGCFCKTPEDERAQILQLQAELLCVNAGELNPRKLSWWGKI